MFRFTGPAFGLLLAATGTAYAATIIELRGSDANQPISNDIEVNGNRVRIIVRDAASVHDIQYDAATDTAYVIDHQERTYTALTEEGIEEIGTQVQAMMTQVQAQLQQSMAGMSEQQKAQLGDVLGSMGFGSAAPAAAPKPARFEADGGMREVGGIPCTEGTMMVDSLPTARLCIARQTDVPLPEGDYRTLRKLVAFGGRLADKITAFFPAVSMAMPSYDIADIDGLPVEVRDGAMHVAVTAIRQESRPAIAVPDGYTQRMNPLLVQ